MRLTRCGRRNSPFYRIAVFDQRERRDGRSIEILGHYDPRNKDEKKQVVMKKDRVKYWLSQGAAPSETVRSLIKRQGYNFGKGEFAGEKSAAAQ
jgi:small subunit ribosomal protein S16